MTGAGYDRSAVSIRLLLAVAGALLLLVIAAAAVLYPVARDLSQVPTAASLAQSTPAAPSGQRRLQVSPQREWQALKQARERLLSSYGWVAEAEGIARIPIARAIDLYAEQRWQSLAERETLAAVRAQYLGWEELHADPGAAGRLTEPEARDDGGGSRPDAASADAPASKAAAGNPPERQTNGEQ